jgi:hypothetical protein
MKKWRSLAEDGHPPVGTVCAYGVNDIDRGVVSGLAWTKGDKVEILAYRDCMAVIYNHTREAADIRNLDYGDEGPLVVALEEVAIDAPDWDNAPEDATHWEPENDEYVESWMKKDGDAWFYFSPKFKTWTESDDIGGRRIKGMIPRPQVEPKEWNGEGLPPVGVDVEYTYHRNGGECKGLCKIMAFNDGYVWFKPSCAKHKVMPIADISLRPLRSEEDRVVEELQAHIEKVYEAKHNFEIPAYSSAIEFTIREMHQLGYRKQEKK